MHDRRRPTFKVVLLLAVALLVIAGAVVTATAAPGPSTDVKSAQYGEHDAARHQRPVQGDRRRGGHDLPRLAQALQGRQEGLHEEEEGRQAQEVPEEAQAHLPELRQVAPLFHGS